MCKVLFKWDLKFLKLKIFTSIKIIYILIIIIFYTKFLSLLLLFEFEGFDTVNYVSNYSNSI